MIFYIIFIYFIALRKENESKGEFVTRMLILILYEIFNWTIKKIKIKSNVYLTPCSNRDPNGSSRNK